MAAKFIVHERKINGCFFYLLAPRIGDYLEFSWEIAGEVDPNEIDRFNYRKTLPNYEPFDIEAFDALVQQHLERQPSATPSPSEPGENLTQVNKGGYKNGSLIPKKPDLLSPTKSSVSPRPTRTTRRERRKHGMRKEAKPKENDVILGRSARLQKRNMLNKENSKQAKVRKGSPADDPPSAGRHLDGDQNSALFN